MGAPTITKKRTVYRHDVLRYIKDHPGQLSVWSIQAGLAGTVTLEVEQVQQAIRGLIRENTDGCATRLIPLDKGYQWIYRPEQDNTDVGALRRELAEIRALLMNGHAPEPEPEPEPEDLWPLDVTFTVVDLDDNRMWVRCNEGFVYSLPRLARTDTEDER